MKLNKSIFDLQKKVKEKIVVATIYKANQKDTDGQYMAPETIGKMRESFHERLSQGKAGVSTLHKGIEGTAFLMSSQINDNGDWIGEFKVKDDSTFNLIEKGILTGVSIEGISSLENDEITDPVINRIAIVEKPANGEPFHLVKEEKSMKDKIISFVNELFKGDKNTMTVEERMTALESQMAEMQKAIASLVAEDQTENDQPVAKSEKGMDERLSKIEKTQKDISDQVGYLLKGGISQSQNPPHITQKKGQEADVFAFMG